MSLSKIFYTLFATKDAILEKAEFSENDVFFQARIRESEKKCSFCGSRNVQIKESKMRTFRGCNLAKKKTFVKLLVHKLLCLQCRKRRWMKLSFTLGKLPLTRSFIDQVIALNSISTLLHVARMCDLEWKTVKNIDKANLKRRPKQFSFKKLRYISIDEIAIKKGHNYMTIISDITTGQIIYAVNGRKDEVISNFLKKLAKRAKRLKGVAMDMSAGYSAAVSKYLPHVDIVFDRFHVTKLINTALDEVRKEEWKKCQEEGLEVSKGQRFLLLRNFDSLKEPEKAGVEKLLEINKNLAFAHVMKEQFRMFWEQKNQQEGLHFFVRWVMAALESNVELLKKVARTLIHHLKGLLSYFIHKIDNGKAEGLNNKIKVMKRQAYGYRDIEYFTLKLYNLHKKTQELVG